MAKPHKYLYEEIYIRPATDVARRSLALFAVIGVAGNAPKENTINWLVENGLWTELSPREFEFLSAPTLQKKKIDQFSWQVEALAVLLWCLRLIPVLSSPDKKCDQEDFKNLLPPISEVLVEQFIASAQLRKDAQIFKLANHYSDLHAGARAIKGGQPTRKMPIAIEIVQERHRAINWVAGYNSQTWDEVTTDA